MDALNLEFPVLCRRSGTGVQVRALFQPGHEVVAPRLRDAYGRVERRVLQQIDSDHFDLRTQLDELLWLTFNPDLQCERVQVEFMMGKEPIRGRFLVIRFRIGEHRLLILPGIGNHISFLPERVRGREARDQHIVQLVERLLRQERRELEDQFLIHHYESPKDEFISTLTLRVAPKPCEFPFAKESELVRLLTGGRPKKFRGAVEMQRVAEELEPDHEEEHAIGREVLVETLGQMLFAPDAHPVALVGPAGAGKTALLQEALRRHYQQVDPQHRHKRAKLWFVDPARVLAGMSVVGQWEKRFEAVLGYARRRLRDLRVRSHRDWLCFDQPLALLSVGKSAQNDLVLADLLRVHLEEGELPTLFEVTPEVWETLQDRDRRLTEFFRVVRVPELGEEEALRVVLQHRARLERTHGTEFPGVVIKDLLEHHRRHGSRVRALPGALVTELERAAARHRDEEVVRDALVDQLQGGQNLRREFSDRDQVLDERELDRHFRGRLLGQEAACRALCDAVHHARAGLANPRRPLVSMLFLGPTGVGKTLAAKLLTRRVFANDEGMVRFDMNEFVDPGAVGRLIGDPLRPEGLLTARVRWRPYCVLLLDEIEKAHPDVHNLLLQLLGDGRLTDASGTAVDFTHTLVIMTSNLGANRATKALGFSVEAQALDAVYRKAAQDFFRPELLNRIDRIVPFRRLAQAEVREIARLEIGEVIQREGLVRRTLFLKISDRLLDQVADAGFDPRYGGRALKRTIQQKLVRATATQLAGIPRGCPCVLHLAARRGEIAPHVVPLTEVERVEFALPGLGGESGAEVGVEIPRLRGELEALFERSSALVGPGPIKPEKLSLEEQAAHHLRSRLQLRLTQLSEIEGELEAAGHGREAALAATAGRGGERKFRWRLCQSRSFRESWWGERKGPVVARSMAEQEARDFLSDEYGKAAVIERGLSGEFRRLALDRVFLEEECCGLEGDGLDLVALEIEPLLEVRGDAEAVVEVLTDMQRAQLQAMRRLGFEPILVVEPTASALQAAVVFSGAGLQEILGGEAGVHLVHRLHRGALPIRAALHRLPPGSEPKAALEKIELARSRAVAEFEEGAGFAEEAFPSPGRIVRHYAPPQAKDRTDLVLDCRTGLMCSWSELELEVLLYGGLIARGLPAQGEGQ